MSNKKPESLAAWENLPDTIRTALINNNLASLKPEERLSLYTTICEAKGLDPATRPFEFITLNGKLQMYARKEAADQLRERNGVNAEIVTAQAQGDAYVVHIRAKNADGRIEDDIGATSITEPEFLSKKDGTKYPNPRFGKKLDGTDLANAMMKAVTKGKRRVTLSICGLGMFDESEIESIAEADKGRAPTLEEVQKTAARVRELREQAAKAKGKLREDLIREATDLEAAIIDLPGSGHTPEDQGQQTGASATVEAQQAASTTAAVQTATEPAKPVVKAPEAEKPAPPAEKPAPREDETRALTAEERAEVARVTSAPAQVETSAATGDGDGWREHTIRAIPRADFKGKKLGEIEPKKIKVIHDNWVLKFGDEIAKNPDKKADAAAVSAAVKELAL